MSTTHVLSKLINLYSIPNTIVYLMPTCLLLGCGIPVGSLWQYLQNYFIGSLWLRTSALLSWPHVSPKYLKILYASNKKRFRNMFFQSIHVGPHIAWFGWGVQKTISLSRQKLESWDMWVFIPVFSNEKRVSGELLEKNHQNNYRTINNEIYKCSENKQYGSNESIPYSPSSTVRTIIN